MLQHATGARALPLLLRPQDDGRRTPVKPRARRGQASEWTPVAATDHKRPHRVARKLYGRSEELRRAAGTYEQAIADRAQMLFVSGAPGAGKTALVTEAFLPLCRTGGRFFGGKFDLVQCSEPFLVWTQIMDRVIDSVLDLPAEASQRLSEHWRKTLGPAAALLSGTAPPRGRRELNLSPPMVCRGIIALLSPLGNATGTQACVARALLFSRDN